MSRAVPKPNQAMQRTPKVLIDSNRPILSLRPVLRTVYVALLPAGSIRSLPALSPSPLGLFDLSRDFPVRSIREQARWPLRVPAFDDFHIQPAATRALARLRRVADLVSR